MLGVCTIAQCFEIQPVHGNDQVEAREIFMHNAARTLSLHRYATPPGRFARASVGLFALVIGVCTGRIDQNVGIESRVLNELAEDALGRR